MRITFVCSVADLTGGFRMIAGYAKRLRDRGHDVLVVSCPPRAPTVREVVRALYRRRPLAFLPRSAATHLDGTGVAHKVLDHRGPPQPRDLRDADVVVATWWETAEWVSALPPEKGVHVHFIQDHETWGGPPQRVDASCRLPMPKITSSLWLQRLLVNQFAQGDVTHIPNAIDTGTFNAPPRGKQPVPTVGFTYTPFTPKGCDVIAGAIQLARKVRRELRVVSFGTSKPTPELPLPAPVDFHLRAPDAMLRELYAGCDAWLFGSRKEGFGLPTLEALACRTPVIATRAGAAPELLQDGGGMLVALEDAGAMADAIVEMCAMSDGDWRAMSDLAHAAARRHSWDEATDTFEAVLVRAVQYARRGAGWRSPIESAP